MKVAVTPLRSLAETAYEKLKASIFDFELLPGDRFTENEIAGRLGMSRTPVRDALYRLEREGYLSVHVRLGWSVRPYDFEQFENLYDLRLILEESAVTRLCERYVEQGGYALRSKPRCHSDGAVALRRRRLLRPLTRGRARSGGACGGARPRRWRG